jgi:hypothetical protein
MEFAFRSRQPHGGPDTIVAGTEKPAPCDGRETPGRVLDGSGGAGSAGLMNLSLLLFLGCILLGSRWSAAASLAQRTGQHEASSLTAAPQLTGRWAGFLALEDTTEVVLFAVRFDPSSWTPEGILHFEGTQEGNRGPVDGNGKTPPPARIRMGRAWRDPSGKLHVSYAAAGIIFTGEWLESAPNGPQLLGQWQYGGTGGVWALAPEEDLTWRIPEWLRLSASPGWSGR